MKHLRTLALGASLLAALVAGLLTATAALAAPTVTTTTTLASATNPVNIGTPTVLTATVTGTNPSGNVSFKNGTYTFGTVALSGTGNTRTASYSVTLNTAGSKGLTAVYAGDTVNKTSTSTTLTQTVNKASASATLTSATNPVSVGAPTVLTATVTGINPSGNVTFKNGAASMGTAALSGSGNTRSATYTATITSAGTKSLTAVYAGDTNNLSATSSTVIQVVTKATSTTTLASSANPAVPGASITLTATVTGSTPSGTVTFKDGATTLGTGTISAGVASYTTAALAAGTHNLTAVYAGNTNNTASTSAVLGQVIIPLATSAMTWRYGYDAMGRPTSTIDPNNLATYTYYDSLGRPIQSQQPANTGSSTPTVISLEYNLADALTKVTDPRSLATTYSPNGLGNVSAQSSPDTGASTYTYDAQGKVKTITDARGKVTTLTYDNLDRLTRISYPVGTPTTLEYDGGPTPTPAARGELTKITDESGTTSYSYDSLGRLTSKTQTTNGKTFTVRYGWGDAGSALDKLTSITYPSGNKVNYAYDAQGYPTAITLSPVNPNGVGTGSTQNLLSTISTNADNNPTGWLWANGKAHTISYDSFGQIASYSLGDATGTGTSAGAKRSITRDAAGRITGLNHTNTASPATAAALNQVFGYDNLNRLVAQTVNGTNTSYAYDATGNRTSKTIGATSYTNTVSPTSNKYTQTQDVTGTASIQYDAAGHITSDGVNTFTYSDRGRMATASNAGGTVNYLYNAFNFRVAKTGPVALVATGASYYVYAENGQLLGEYDSNGAPIYETVYRDSTPVGVMKQTGTAAQGNIAVSLYNVHADHLATPRVITRASDNAIVWRWDTAEAFGATAPNQDPSGLGTFVYNPRFPGQVADSETGLFQNVNREFGPREGRYRQSDPIGLNGGINTFAYAYSSPLAFTDPSGLQVPMPPIPVPIPGVPNPAADANKAAADQISRILRGDDDSTTTYQTYTRYNPLTGDCYSGRTSGTDTPENNVRNRGYGQPLLNAEGFLPPVLDRSSTNKSSIRGREQQLIDVNGGAQSTGGTSRNKINGISPINPRGPLVYIPAAIAEFGIPVPAGKCTCQ